MEHEGYPRCLLRLALVPASGFDGFVNHRWRATEAFASLPGMSFVRLSQSSSLPTTWRGARI
jgi:hypothetical protein